MADLFISYSRRNIEIARRLSGTFEEHDLDFWIDWESIEPTVDWWREIYKACRREGVGLEGCPYTKKYKQKVAWWAAFINLRAS